jgi:poly-gamma-glutamate synthesis protein (capsule biosynthesis protein)
MITFLALGDVCPGDHYFTLGHGLGSRFAVGAQPFAPVLPMLSAADLVLCNLEGPIAEHSDRVGTVESTVFRGPPVVGQRLREAGITLAQVANNHSLQHGCEAHHDTLAALQQAGVTPLGLRGQGYTCAPVIRQVGSLSLGLLGYSLVQERYVPGQQEYAAPDVSDMLADVRALARHVDQLVVSVHWGDEAVALPSPAVVDIARALIDEGARVVLGHHSHVFQPVVRYRGGLIAYSLGNAVFDLFWHRPLVESALLRIQLERDSEPAFDLVPVRFCPDYLLTPMAPRQAHLFRYRLERAAMLMENLSPAQYADFYTEHLRASEGAVQWRKWPFFLRNLGRGQARQKAGFAYRKLASRWSTP